MDELRRKAYLNLVLRVISIRAGVLFLAAWSLDYWQAWLFLAVNIVGEMATTTYLARHDPELLRRRMNYRVDAEPRGNQQQMMQVAQLAFVCAFALSGLDHRWHWSHIPAAVSVLGDVAVAGGLAIVWLAFRANTFAAAIVDVEAEQRVVSNGPYALVRHPMYTGLIVMMAGMGPALGSWWGFPAVAVATAGFIARLLDEEQFLAKNLAGYDAYRERVRHRLAPLVW